MVSCSKYLVIGVWISLLAALSVSLAGCDEPQDDRFEKVTIKDKVFTLELSLTPEKRTQGLSGRDKIPEDGGMLFVFPDREVSVHDFVMRDCSVPIDIIFLDRASRVTTTHAMKVEDPRKPDEPKPRDPLREPDKYEQRLKRYSSKYAAQFAIELAGGTLEKLDLKEGEQIKLDVEALKKRAK